MAASAFTAGAWKMRRRQLYPEAAAAAAAAVADDSDDDDTGARDGWSDTTSPPRQNRLWQK